MFFKDICIQIVIITITVEAGLKQIDFLDIKLNLNIKTYFPFKKPNSRIFFVSSQNYPRQIIKKLPITINKRINKLSSDEEPFNHIKQNYLTAVKPANYKFDLTYQNINNKHKKQRKRKIIYFNPPISLTVATKIVNEFLKLVHHHFTIKLLYSWMDKQKCLTTIINS